MKAKRDSKGLTLIEVLVSIALLSLTSIILLTIFSGAFSSIFSMGRKTKAVADAQSIIDQVYESGDTTTAYIQSLEGSPENIPFDDPYDPNTNGAIRFNLNTIVIDGQNFNKLDVLVFYQNGERNIQLSALIPLEQITEAINP